MPLNIEIGKNKTNKVIKSIIIAWKKAILLKTILNIQKTSLDLNKFYANN